MQTMRQHPGQDTGATKKNKHPREELRRNNQGPSRAPSFADDRERTEATPCSEQRQSSHEEELPYTSHAHMVTVSPLPCSPEAPNKTAHDHS